MSASNVDEPCKSTSMCNFNIHSQHLTTSSIPSAYLTVILPSLRNLQSKNYIGNIQCIHYMCSNCWRVQQEKLTMNELQNHMMYVKAPMIAPLRRTFNSVSRMPSIFLMKKNSHAYSFSSWIMTAHKMFYSGMLSYRWEIMAYKLLVNHITAQITKVFKLLH